MGGDGTCSRQVFGFAGEPYMCAYVDSFRAGFGLSWLSWSSGGLFSLAYASTTMFWGLLGPSYSILCFSMFLQFCRGAGSQDE
jgi:hypothetical protein